MIHRGGGAVRQPVRVVLGRGGEESRSSGAWELAVDYLKEGARGGDVWIIIQPFFRRLEPQSSGRIGSEQSRRRSGGADEVEERRQWHHGKKNMNSRSCGKESDKVREP